MPDTKGALVKIDTAFKALHSPVWSENKAKLIQTYVRYFILITHHGTYIDAFAGPQVEVFNDQSWSAKMVLEIQPAWLRRFILCELNPAQMAHLSRLVEDRRKAGDKRSIELRSGDCNNTLPAALAANPIKPKEATFCLLDQRTFECDWATVRSVASHKSEGNKIELFYFLPVGWLHRSMSGLKDDSTLARWWGKDDVSPLHNARNVHSTAKLFTDRFEQELGYASVRGWPILERSSGGRIMYYMIHAADHPEAPKLMYRAYKNATGAMEPMEHLQAEFEAQGFDRSAMEK